MGDEVMVRDGRTRSVWLVVMAAIRPGGRWLTMARYGCLTAALQCQQWIEYDCGYCARVVEGRESIDG